MTRQEDDFEQQLRATFRVEAEEHVQVISDGLLALEKAGNSQVQAEIVEGVFRAAHSLKGAARAVGLSRVASLCQSLEDVFAAWKRQDSAPSPAALDTPHRALDAIISALGTPADAPVSGREPDASSLLRQSLRLGERDAEDTSASVGVAMASSDPFHIAGPTPAGVAPALAISQRTDPQETVRIPVARLEKRLLDAEEMLTVKLAAAQRAADLRELRKQIGVWRETWAGVEADLRTLRARQDQIGHEAGSAERRVSAGLPRLLEFFDSSLDVLKSIEHRTADLRRAAEQDRQLVGKLVDDLLDESKKLLLLPFATISGSFPKLVRDLCRDQDKEAELVIRGEEIELDKRILEEIKDPLVHLLRNSVDHGVELPAQRVQRGKAARATITLTISQLDASKVQVVLSDDGAGIDRAKVKDSAVRQRLLSMTEADSLDDAATQALIFESALSTSPMITEISGRGLGLAIVREKTTKLGGSVTVESRPHEGTTFRIVVPAVRTTLRGVLVRAAGRLLIVPSVAIERVARATSENTATVEGRDTLWIEGRAIGLVSLAAVLELPVTHQVQPARRGTPVVIIGTGDQRIAFSVDAVLDEQELLAKPLRKPLTRVRNVAAATVLGSGELAPVLNVADLLKSARHASRARAPDAAAVESTHTTAKSILVAEDSITSRMLLKSILESGGYTVKTAVDGLEAFTLLRTEHFDLLVSDVEMPRLNGFDLTARVRADPKLSELPIVLVTALDTREHKERGIDVGANAYLVKSSVEESNLLGAVRRLI